MYKNVEWEKNKWTLWSQKLQVQQKSLFDLGSYSQTLKFFPTDDFGTKSPEMGVSTSPWKDSLKKFEIFPVHFARV